MAPFVSAAVEFDASETELSFASSSCVGRVASEHKILQDNSGFSAGEELCEVTRLEICAVVLQACVCGGMWVGAKSTSVGTV